MLDADSRGKYPLTELVPLMAQLSRVSSGWGLFLHLDAKVVAADGEVGEG